MTYYGTDNQIDGVVLDVLLRKHRTIRSSPGISVAVPANTSEVIQALMQGLLLRDSSADSRQLTLFDLATDAYRDLHTRWEDATEKEGRSRTLFAQRTIDVTEVAQEWKAVQAALGTGVDVQRFMQEAVTAHGGTVGQVGNLSYAIHLPNKTAICEACGDVETFTARFELPVSDDVIYLNRTHPIVEGLASYVMDAALDPLLASRGVARRCGAIRTRAVTVRTTLLLARFRYHILTQHVGAYDYTPQQPLLAEDCRVLGFTGAPDAAIWLAPDEAEALLDARPDANITPQQASDFVRRVIDRFDHLRAALNATAEQRGQEVLDAHRRVRAAARMTDVRYAVQPQLPPGVLGIYVLLPVVK